MKLYVLLPLAALLTLTVACGPSEAEKTARLETAAARIDSLICSDGAPVERCSATYAAPNIDVDIALTDSLVKVDLLGDALMDYFVADQLKAMDSGRVYAVINSLRKLETPVVATIRDSYGSSKTFVFNADKISRLMKAKGSSLDVPSVRGQVAAMAGGAVPAPDAHRGAQVSTAISKGFLTYTMTFPSKASLAGLEQGNLTGRYLDALRRQYARLGNLEYPVVEMLKGLGIDGVRIVYVAADDDSRELKQAFPWREIFK